MKLFHSFSAQIKVYSAVNAMHSSPSPASLRGSLSNKIASSGHILNLSLFLTSSFSTSFLNRTVHPRLYIYALSCSINSVYTDENK